MTSEKLFKALASNLGDTQAQMMTAFIEQTYDMELAVRLFGAALGDCIGELHAYHKRHIEAGCENCGKRGLPDYRQLFFNAFDEYYRAQRDAHEQEDREAIANANHVLENIFKGHKK